MPSWLPVNHKENIIKAADGIIRQHNLRSELLGKRRFADYLFSGAMIFNILGEGCTRNCKFCHIRYLRRPSKPTLDEGRRIAAVAHKLGLRYVILSPVIRDDLRDGGASYLAHCIREIKKENPGIVVETFIPDYEKKQFVRIVLDAKPDIIGHSIDTIKRLYPVVKGSSFDFERTIRTIKTIRKHAKDTPIRATLLVGFREDLFEVIGTMRRLKRAGVDMLTIGQYYRPTKNHLLVMEYVPPEKFAFYEREAYQLGYRQVTSQADASHAHIAPEFISSVFSRHLR